MDILPTGAFHYNLIHVTPFVPNVYKKKGNLAIDIVRIILLFVVFGLYIKDLIYCIKDSKDLITKKIWNMILVSLVLGVFLASFIIKFKHLNKDDKHFFSDYLIQYTDSNKISIMYRYMLLLESIFLLLLTIKALSFLELFSITTLLFSSIGHTILMFFQFLIALLCVLFALASIMEIVWGSYLEECKTFGLSFISVLLLSSMYYSPRMLLDHDMYWGILFIIIILIVQLFIFIALFTSIFAESLRRSVCTYGYPEDYKEKKWDLSDYKVWIIHFIDDPKEKKEDEEMK